MKILKILFLTILTNTSFCSDDNQIAKKQCCTKDIKNTRSIGSTPGLLQNELETVKPELRIDEKEHSKQDDEWNEDEEGYE